MKILGRFLFLCMAGAALLLAPLSPAKAELKPLLVVSVASVDELVADVNYVTKAAGMEGSGKFAEGYIKAFSNGADRKRPIGAVVVPKQLGEFVVMSFVPVTDMKAILATLKESLGEPKDAGDGVLELSVGPQMAYIKEANGWAFVARQKEHLAELPADPAALLGNLPKDYTIAAKVLLQNLPADWKKMAADQIRMGFENNLRNAPNNPALDRELMEKLNRNGMENIIRMLDELDEFTIGFNIDAPGQRTYLDIGWSAVAGTRLAKQAEAAANVKSSFAGFLMPGAAAAMNFAGPVSKEDLEQSRVLLEGFRTNALKALDDDPSIDATRRAAVKQLLTGVFDVVVKTAEAGKMDGGGVLMLEPKSLNTAVGMLVSDGAKVESLVKELANLAKTEPEAPAIKLNASQHGGITFHTVTAPIPDDGAEAREILGDKVNVIVGTGPQAVYVAFGRDPEGLLKKVIDANAQVAKDVPPAQVHVAVLPILKFAASVDKNPIVPALISVLEKSGKDKVTIVSEPRPRGGNSRILVEEGVLQLIGEGAKQAGLGGGGPRF